MASSMCGGDQVRSTKISVSCLQSSMVVGMSWCWRWRCWRVTFQWGKHKLQHVLWNTAEEYPLNPETGSQGMCSSMTMTQNTPPRQPLFYWRGWGDWLAKSVSWLKPNRHLWGILKRKVEVKNVSNILPLRDVVIEQWKKIQVGSCDAPGNSMPRRVKPLLDNEGGHTKYWKLT